MALPAPNLDDRRFQDLVDDAKRLVQQRCPEWTDHNVSDPGVTLIETFAFMVDQLLYRVNRVPDRTYVKFLELIGLRLFPPTAARAEVTFWLSAPQPETLRVPAGTEVATVRTEAEEAVTFTLPAPLEIVPCAVERLASTLGGPLVRDHTDTIGIDEGFYCFDAVPKPGDALLVGLDRATPSNAVLLRFDCEIEGVGVDPRNPPLVWEAWTGERWSACEVDRDGTGGLNRAGDVVLHVPRGHVVSLVNRQRAAWLRCRVVPGQEGQPVYSASPLVKTVTACTIGGTADAVHAQVVRDEVLGLSEAVPGQRFGLRRQPVVAAEELPVLEVATTHGWQDRAGASAGPDGVGAFVGQDGVGASAGQDGAGAPVGLDGAGASVGHDGAGASGWQEWTAVENFAASGPGDRHFLLDARAAEVVLGPAVRQPDGTLRAYGAVPPKGATLRLRSYAVGGGRRGNVARHALSVLKSSLPYVTRVENRRAACGGVDGEDLEDAKLRGPILMRTRNRAVTAEDYEQLARESAPSVARVRCAPAGDGADPGAVRVLVVPDAADDEQGRLRFEQLVPPSETLSQIARCLDERRVIGARVVVEPPTYQGITVVARLRARSRASTERLRTDALAALYRYFHPIRGGPEGRGWPFGRPIHTGEVYAVLQRLTGTEFVEDVKLFAADPVTGERGGAVQRIDVAAHALVFSYEHQVRVDQS